jgi:hypothetical protein
MSAARRCARVLLSLGGSSCQLRDLRGGPRDERFCLRQHVTLLLSVFDFALYERKIENKKRKSTAVREHVERLPEA